MKRSGKPLPPAVPGAPVPPAGSDRRAKRGSRLDAGESVAGEEDPGSALEQFSDLMHDAPAEGGAAADAPVQRTQAGERRRGSATDAAPLPETDSDPDTDRRP